MDDVLLLVTAIFLIAVLIVLGGTACNGAAVKPAAETKDGDITQESTAITGLTGIPLILYTVSIAAMTVIVCLIGVYVFPLRTAYKAFSIFGG